MTIVASMLNSMLTTSYYAVKGVDIVPELLTRFLVGDVLGTVVLMLLFSTFRGWFLKWTSSIT